MSSPAIVNIADVSLQLTHALDEEGEYGAFTNVQADIILHQTKKIGKIEATIIDRQRIPDGHFLSAMDSQSQALQEVGTAVFEPRCGRTKLRSLTEHDSTEFDTMLIDSFHIEDEYKVNGASDVGAAALCQFMHHPFIKGDLRPGSWRVSSAVYLLDPLAAMATQEKSEFIKKRDETWRSRRLGGSPETGADREAKAAEAQRLDTLARLDANQFLRNGFFQDPAIARQGYNNFLVASCADWDRKALPTMSHEQATAVQFYVPPPKPPPPSGKDADILDLVKRSCSPYTKLESAELGSLLGKIARFMVEGGSISRSNALHAACANNDVVVLTALLEMEEPKSSLVNALDNYASTPLMVAALSAAGRCNMRNGIPETRVIETLLAAGADKSIQNSLGLTAYGVFTKQSKDYNVALASMIGQAVMGGGFLKHPTVIALEMKLMPPGGPSASDLNGGEGPESGFMNYDEEDGMADDEMANDGDY